MDLRKGRIQKRNNFPRAAINAIMQIKRIAAMLEKMIFARLVIPIIGKNKRDERDVRTGVYY